MVLWAAMVTEGGGVGCAITAAPHRGVLACTSVLLLSSLCLLPQQERKKEQGLSWVDVGETFLMIVVRHGVGFARRMAKRCFLSSSPSQKNNPLRILRRPASRSATGWICTALSYQCRRANRNVSVVVVVVVVVVVLQYFCVAVREEVVMYIGVVGVVVATDTGTDPIRLCSGWSLFICFLSSTN